MSPRPNVNTIVRPSKKKAALQCWEIFHSQISLKLNKDKRLEIDKKNKFNLESPSDDYIKKLKEQLSEVFVQEYYKKLISDEIKNNVEAVNLLINYLDEFAIQTEFSIVEYLDIFLKWILWKVNSNQNPSIVKALLELFDLIGEIFLQSDQNLRLNDIESYIIINVLCEKLGNNNEKIRDQSREILLDKYLNTIISVSKFNSELCNIISNLNKPTKLRSECIEIINYLFKESENSCSIFTIRDIKSLVKAYVNSKSTDANKNKIQDFIFNYFYLTEENYLIYLNDFDPKTKDSIISKLSKWIKTQQNLSANTNLIRVNNQTPRLTKNQNDLSHRNYNNKEFDSINKSDDNISINSKSPNAIKGTIKIEKKGSKAESTYDENMNDNDSRDIDDFIQDNKSIKYNKVNYKIQNANLDENMNNQEMLMNKGKGNDKENYFHTPKRDSSNKLNNVVKNSRNNNNLNKSNILNSQIINNSIQNSNLDNSIMNTNANIDPKKKTYILEEKEDLFTILETLNNGNEPEKVNTILIIHDIINAKFEASKHILIPNIDEIIKAFILALKKLFENANTNLNQIPIKLGKYLITVLYKISSNKELIKNISINVLFNLTEEVLSNLIIENLDKIGENQEGIVIIRSLNSTMLRLLENCDYTQVIEMLLDIVMKYKNSFEKSKISGLGIKCLLKIHQILEQIVNSIKLDKLLLKIHLIFCEFDRMNKGSLESENQTDQMIIRFIKNFIYEIVKIKREGIVGDYRLVEKHSDKDKYIKKWIKSILESLNSNNENNDISTEMKGITVKKMDKSETSDSKINLKSDSQSQSQGKKISVSPMKKNMNSHHNNSNYNQTARNMINIDRDLSVIYYYLLIYFREINYSKIILGLE